MTEYLNPYATPLSEITTESISDNEQLRKKHLTHETNLKSFGALNYLAGVFIFFAGIAMLLGLNQANRVETAQDLASGIVVILLGLLYLWVGRGLRTCNSKVKIPATILALIGMINVPIGTLLSFVLLYLMYNKNASIVFSEEYREAIKATPHIKYKTPAYLLVFVGILLLVVVIAVSMGFIE